MNKYKEEQEKRTKELLQKMNIKNTKKFENNTKYFSPKTSKYETFLNFDSYPITKCLEDYELGKLIGSGVGGSVYLSTKKNNSPKTLKYAIKHIKLIKFSPEEVEIATFMGNLEVGPKIYETEICGKDVYIISEYIDGMQLSEYMNLYDCIPVEIYNLLEKKLDIMHQNNISHLDLTTTNIMLKLNYKDDKILDLFIIDYGFAVYDEFEEVNIKYDRELLFESEDYPLKKC